MSELDSEELSEWYAFDQRWPLPDHWLQTARICRIIMAASGNYKTVPKEAIFIPTAASPEQTQEQIVSELMKLQEPQG